MGTPAKWSFIIDIYGENDGAPMDIHCFQTKPYVAGKTGCIEQEQKQPGNLFGGFLKWGYPQIIHFNRMSPYKQSIWGYPIDGKPHLDGKTMIFYRSSLKPIH